MNEEERNNTLQIQLSETRLGAAHLSPDQVLLQNLKDNKILALKKVR